MIANPRYPHTITIKRTVVTDASTPTSPDPFGGGSPVPTTEIVTLYSGIGKNYLERTATVVDGVSESLHTLPKQHVQRRCRIGLRENGGSEGHQY